MNNNLNKSEKIIREKLEEFSMTPSDKIWTGIRKGVRKKNLMQFRFVANSRIASIMTVFSILAILVLSILFIQNNHQINKSDLETAAVLSPESMKNSAENEAEKIELTQDVNKIEVNEKDIAQTANRSLNGNETINSGVPKTKKIAEKWTHTDNENDDKLKLEGENTNDDKPSKEVNEPNENRRVAVETLTDKKIEEDSVIILPDSAINQLPGIDPIAPDSIIDLHSKKIKFPLELKVWGGAEMVFSDFSLFNKSDPETYLTQRKANESALIYSSQGVDLRWKNSKNLVLQTGINLTRVGEQAEYTRLQMSIDSIGYFVDTIIKFNWLYNLDSFGRVIDSFVQPSMDTSGFVIYDSSSKTVNEQYRNRYTYVEIPLLIGFTTQFDKIEIGASTGFSLGYLSAAEGKVPDPLSEEFLVLHVAEEFLNRWTLNYLLRLHLAYPLSSQLKIFAEPSFKYNLISASNDHFPIKQKYYAIGVHFGLQYKF